MRVAAVDCGTNSIRLLVRDGERELHREMRIVRLGQDVDRTGRLAPAALERTRAALADYATIVRDLGVEHTRMIATSATRDADNQGEFVAMVRNTLGVEPEVISGRAEAQLSYSGAVDTLPGVDGRVLLVDLGGGSTELVLGPEPVRAHSMDVGSVRMTERHFADDPPTSEQAAALVRDVATALDRAQRDVPWDEADHLVGVAGTITTVAALALGLDSYQPDAIHGARVGVDQIEAVTEQLLGLDHAGRAALSVIHPGRVDVITAGALVLRTVVRRCGTGELIASEHDILDGVARSIS